LEVGPSGGGLIIATPPLSKPDQTQSANSGRSTSQVCLTKPQPISQDEDIVRDKGGITATEHEFVKSRSAFPVESHDFAVKGRIQLSVYEQGEA